MCLPQPTLRTSNTIQVSNEAILSITCTSKQGFSTNQKVSAAFFSIFMIVLVIGAVLKLSRRKNASDDEEDAQSEDEKTIKNDNENETKV